MPRDSFVVSKLRAAGAIILGKANLSEWAYCRSINGSTNGWSAYGGQGTGAYYPNQNPCGSSSGSGVAVSIGLAAAALGTEVCLQECNQTDHWIDSTTRRLGVSFAPAN